MDNIFLWFLIAVAGFLLGIVFFGGLWWTTRKGLDSKSPVWWFFGSFILRFGIVLAGFYFISNHRWERMLICLGGFIIARFIVMRFTQQPELTTAGSKGGE